MIAETSVQAQFLIPMAVSLGFGVLFVTVIALCLVPAFYCVTHDFLHLVRKSAGSVNNDDARVSPSH